MANTDKDILITPNRGSTNEPKIEFKGASSSVGPSTITATIYPTNNGTLSFDGTEGQLFSIANNLSTGSIFSVNPISGIPIIDVNADRTIALNPYGGNTGIGLTNPSYKLDVNGTARFSGQLTIPGNNSILFGPNSTWSRYLRIGGNGWAADSTTASVVTTDGNLHLDAADANHGIYLNWYGGTNGTFFGNGAAGQIGRLDGSGNFSVSGTITGTQITSNIANGTAPFVVSSTTKVTNLNADYLDDQSGSYYLDYNNFTNTPTIGNGTITVQGTTGLTGSGSFTVNQTGTTTVTLNHADTSSQASVDNSNGTVIQDVTLDEYGHVTGLASIDLDGRYYTESEINDKYHDFQWRWIRYGGYIAPAAGDNVSWTNYFRTYFLNRTPATESSYPTQDSGYISTYTVGTLGGFGGSTYGNIFGDLGNYHCHIYTHIYVERQFSINPTQFNGDDPHAIFINGVFVHGNVSCCVDTSYAYTFQPGWYRIDLIYSEGGGGDFIQMGWNPKDYTTYIKDMTSYRAPSTIFSENTFSSLKPSNNQLQVNINSPASSSGSWTTASSNDEWGNPKFDGVYNEYRYADAPAWVQYNIPAGMKSAWISQLTWSSGGYVDIHGIQSGGQLVFLRRINTRQTVENTDEGVNHDGSTVTFAASGLDDYSAIRFTVQSGRFHLTGLSFSTADNEGTEGVGMVHPAQISHQGAGSGLDADTVDGLNPSTSGTSNIVSRDASGNFNAGTLGLTGINIDGGNLNNTNDATAYITSTNNNDWGLIVDKFNTNATEYGQEIRVASGASYAFSILGSGTRNFRINGAGSVFATNFSDSTGSYNVNLGSGGIEGRGLVAGYSGGSYGGIGYNVRHTTTGGQWIAPGTDTSSYLLFNSAGFTFYGEGGGAAGRTLSYTTLATLSSAGGFTAYGDLRAPIFRDTDNTDFYLNPATDSLLRAVTIRDGGLKLERAYANNSIWFAGGTDDNHVLWNDYYGGPGARGGAGSGFDGMKWNTYKGIYFKTGQNGQYNSLEISGSGASTNDHQVYLYGANDEKLRTVTTDGIQIQRDLYISGSAGGNYGNRLIVGNTDTSYTLQDGSFRPTIQAHGQYPVVSLNNTATGNPSHGPTLQFTCNGTGNQFVIGTNGTGTFLSMGYSNAGDWNPHNGIDGYNGTSFFHANSSGNIGLGVGGDWGSNGGGNPGYNLHFVGSNNATNGHAAFFDNRINGANNGSGFLFRNLYGNHSWGIVAEYRVEGAPGSDRPSILFSTGYNSNTWSVGYGSGSDDNFRINYDHGHRNTSWGTTAVLVDRSSIMTVSGEVRSPIFKDSDSTSYYGDFGNTGTSIVTAGNIGAKTTSPLQALDVRGNFLLAADATTATHITQKPYTLNGGTLSWEGSAGQLFSITNNLTSGSIFSVNDVSGLPSIDVDANGTILFAPYGGNTGIGLTNPSYKLDVNGTTRFSGASIFSSNISLSNGYIRAITNNQPAILSVASGTASSQASFAIQQETAEGWTGIFVDFEPYTGWGLYHDNPNNYFCVTSESSTGSIRSFTVPSRVSGNRTAYEKIRFDQNNGNLISGGEVQGTIFRDVNDANYYVDPNGTSRILDAYIVGGVAGVSNSSAYHEAAIEVRERGFGGTQDDTWATAPRIGFHWSGRVASQIALASNGRISILNNPGNAYENFQCNDAYVNSVNLPNGFQISQGGSNYGVFNSWVRLDGTYGFYSGTNNAHFYVNDATYGSWRIDGSRNGWYGIHFNSGSTLMMNSNEVGFHREGTGWQMRWSAGTGYIHKGNPGGGTTATIWDSVNAGRAANSNLMYYQGFTLDANTMESNSTGFTYSVNAPYTGPVVRFSTGGGYDLWLNSPYNGNGYGLAFRTRNGDTGAENSWQYPAVYGVNSNGGGDLYSTRYYDSNDVNYYVDPASTSVLNTVTVNGSLNAYANPITVNRINFRSTSGSSQSDPYCIRWMDENSNGGLSWLEFQLNDDSNEEIRIYGNSCSGYGCGEISGNLYHRFRADGYAWHSGNLEVGGNVTATNFYGNGSNLTGITAGATLSASSGSQRVVLTSLTSGTMTTAATSSALTFDSSTGTLSSTIFTSTSDITKKTNIQNITNAVDLTKQINGVKFDWKETGESSAGVIAQEVEEVLPEIVHTNDEGIKSVNYNGVVGLLVEAIKEQQKQIDELKKELKKLHK